MDNDDDGVPSRTELGALSELAISALTVMLHPCLNGPPVGNLADGPVTIHPTCRVAERHTSAPWWKEGGIRSRVGGMRHVPLAEFLTAFLRSGLHLEEVHEPGDEAVPCSILVVARAGPAQAVGQAVG